MKTFYVNFDYEWKLFNKNLNKEILKKVQQEFEFIYFFIEKNKTALKTDFRYPDNYLDFISKLGAVIPVWAKHDAKSINWWGELRDIQLEKALNSKLTSYEISKKFNILPPGVELIDNSETLIKYLDEKNEKTFIVKDPESMGGQGNLVFDKCNLDVVYPKIIKMLKSCKIIISPFFERINDYGICYDIPSGMINVNQNFNTKAGIFRGGFSIPAKEKWPNFVNSLSQVFNTYIEMGAYGELQIDSFTYSGPKDLGSYPVVEVNFRKTMGTLIRKLNYIFEHKISCPALVIIKNEDLKIDLFSYPYEDIFDRFGFEVISPQYLQDFRSGRKIVLKNIFLIISTENAKNKHNVDLLNLLKPDSSSSDLIKNHILKS